MPCRICRRHVTHAEQAIDLRLALRTALHPAGHLGRILVVLREAEALATALDDPRRLGQVSGLLASYFYNVGAYDQGITASQRVLALATASGDVVLYALANYFLGGNYLSQGDYRQAIDYLRQTVETLDGERRYERFGNVALPAVSSRAVLAWCHAELGMFAEGRALAEEGLQIAETVAHPASLMWAYYGSGLLSLRQGDLPRALLQLERALGSCQDTDRPAVFPAVAVALGTAYTLCGRIADAVLLLTQVLEQTTAGETVAYRARCNLSLGEAQLLAGRLEEAHALAERALALARTHQERGYQAYALRLLGDIAVRCEPPESAQAEESLPPGPHPGRGTGHAPAPGPLPPRPWHAVCHDRPAGASSHRAVRGHRTVPCHGHDVLAAPDRSGAGAGGGTVRRPVAMPAR